MEHKLMGWRTESPGIGELLSRLVHEIKDLLDQRITLARLELKEQVARAGRDVAMIALGGIVGLLGVVLLILALGLWVGQALGSTPGGLALVGAAIAIIGGALIGFAIAQLKRQKLVPQTREELRRDAQWMKTGT